MYQALTDISLAEKKMNALQFYRKELLFINHIICQIKRDKTFHLRNSKKLLMVFGNLVIF
ncbi:hypothetical protein EGW65_03870 [Enterococcus faecium]|nr:hypothetical protein EGW41_03870 [Enterococcus faecium]ROY30594.1 hypothetical protein EGW52_04820 [Enterococcus faecium]ROY43712.1 hypothetical protein EGW51_04820 [Enterococcus faecium]ROY51182.1 hypothetical protein EGW75_05445 [Enterococcus faecium]ROY65884.1 hypothetical protein EGW65_03870 [Enterococcus faecium]